MQTAAKPGAFKDGLVSDPSKATGGEFDNLYRPYLETLYKEDEITSNDMDVQKMLSQLNQKEINYDKVFAFVTK